MPYRIFIRVDLPAPFSPTIACTSPEATSTFTSSLASTPGNRFVIPRSSTAAASGIDPPGPPTMASNRPEDTPGRFDVLLRSDLAELVRDHDRPALDLIR